MTWSERLDRAQAAWRSWNGLPLEIRMDRVLKESGLRDLIVTRERLLSDLAAIKRQIEQVEAGVPPCDDWQTTITADQLQALGWCRVIAQTALEDHPGVQIREIHPSESFSGGHGA